MFERDYDAFSTLLDEAYALHLKALPVEGKAVFFRAMQPYPIEVVRAAMTAHVRDKVRGQYPPKPADLIAKIEGAAENDGRPGADEAWAIALTSRDESDTVVWTREMAEAFALCKPVLDMGDEVGARMAFKDAYARLIAAARAAGMPAQWSASLGWDQHKRTAVLTKASTAGLLPAPTVAALLPPPEGAPANDTKARTQVKAIKEMLAQMQAEKQREVGLHAQREREATAQAKQRTSDMVEQYGKDAA